MSIDFEKALGQYTNDSDPAKAALATSLVSGSEAWRELYGVVTIPVSAETPRLHPSLEGKVQLEPVIFSGLSKKNLYEMVSQKVVDIDAYTREIVESSDILPSPESSHITLVDGKVGDLVPNPKGRLATDEELRVVHVNKGLKPVTVETFLHYILQYGDTIKPGEARWMYMEPRADRVGDPCLLGVERYGDGLWLRSDWTEPSSE